MENEPKYDVKELAEKWMRGALTPDEEAFLWRWYNSFDDQEVRLTESAYRGKNELKSAIYHKLFQRIPQHNPGKFRKWPKRGVVLAAGLSVAVVLIFTVFTPLWNKRPAQVMTSGIEDVLPGENKAIVTLPDGRHLSLSPEKDGVKSHNGGLFYTDGTPVNEKNNRNSAEPGEQEWLTIETPYGGQYKVVLPDGSKVWLNAGSSLQYPVQFNDTSRVVRFQGEGYFEIAHVPLKNDPSAHTPFTVHMDRQTVRVTGTAFNIHGYKEEAGVQTTLVSGEVQVIREAEGPEDTRRVQTLKPNEQAIVTAQNIQVHAVNVENAIAWKNGVFLFENDNLRDIMHQLQRWYNVEVDFESIPSLHFTGSIDRTQPLSKVLEMLEVTSDRTFKIKSRKIYMQTAPDSSAI